MKVIMIYGSENDKPFMEPARVYLSDSEVAYEETVLSAHRNLSELIDFLHENSHLEESLMNPWVGGIYTERSQSSKKHKVLVSLSTPQWEIRRRILRGTHDGDNNG